ncbi:MAG: DUF3078 domain-containing protein [Bacteroidales bacterium]|nr:DUF3078 domain-containing protein [Bacteroidales bacterium]
MVIDSLSTVGAADSLSTAGAADSLSAAGAADTLSAAGVADTLPTAGAADSLSAARVTDSLLNYAYVNIDFDPEQAIVYLKKWYESDIWNDDDHPLRQSVRRLLFEATNDPLYLAEDYIRHYDWDKIKIPARNFYMWDTILIPIPSEKGDIAVKQEEADIFDPLLADTKMPVKDTTGLVATGDTLSGDRESITIDPLALDNIFVQTEKRDPSSYGQRRHDSIIIVISDTLRQVISTDPDFPFQYYDYPMVGDSIHSAVNSLMNYIEENDSSRVYFIGDNNIIPVWLTNNTSRMTRLWLKNEWNERMSVWVGGISRDSIDIIVERGVHFRRPDKTSNIADAKIEVRTVDNSRLAEARKIDVKPQYWKFLSEASFVFNQAVLSNWTKGGESNVSTLLDITGNVNYTNEEKKMVWDNQGRIKFGLITSSASEKMRIRKNIDQLDIVSKFNNKAFGKFDFSATMLFQTQMAPGYKYPNDSVKVSKFFNPASLTVGLGLDYKPNDNLSVNFAPLSYKATFVPDTAMIDPTNHGLRADQRSKHEPGLSAQINHKATVLGNIKLVNKVRLFTNYINNPLNIDIDWEMIATAKLNWFTDIRLNTHLIYDDDTLIPVKDEDGEPVLNSEGDPKKVPMIQFKEMIGLSVIFRF